MTEIILITGMPGTGKSSMVQEIIKESGIKAGGISTPEIRIDGKREGFKIRNIQTGKEGILASINIKTRPGIGKYGINIDDLNNIGVQAIQDAIDSPDIELIVIDELGAMEMCSDMFEKVVEKAFKSGKNLLVVLHRKLVDRYGEKGKLFKLTRDNRESVKKEILEILI